MLDITFGSVFMVQMMVKVFWLQMQPVILMRTTDVSYIMYNCAIITLHVSNCIYMQVRLHVQLEAVPIQGLEIGSSVIIVKNGIIVLVLELQMPQLAEMTSSIFATFASSQFMQ